ncbi:ATP-binding protein [Streptomyces canus]|uniref:ATP-binding protein n=1 Tax=Streptomyces canus TaxID=58343 RepID=UPI003717BAD5
MHTSGGSGGRRSRPSWPPQTARRREPSGTRRPTAQARSSRTAGPAAFEAEDPDWFFGRERLVDAVTAQLEKSRFVAVFGASGSGKSSLLRAGVVPRWRTAHGQRRTVVVVPGAHPLRTSAAALVPSAVPSADTQPVDSAADDQALHLHRAVRQALADQGDGAELLLVVDQFEEVFTLCRESDERLRVIRALVAAAHAEDSRCRVVLGVRADFYPHCTRHPELSEACGGAQVAVGQGADDGGGNVLGADEPTRPCPAAVSMVPVKFCMNQEGRTTAHASAPGDGRRTTTRCGPVSSCASKRRRLPRKTGSSASEVQAMSCRAWVGRLQSCRLVGPGRFRRR